MTGSKSEFLCSRARWNGNLPEFKSQMRSHCFICAIFSEELKTDGLCEKLFFHGLLENIHTLITMTFLL